jgi:hypothetical protein
MFNLLYTAIIIVTTNLEFEVSDNSVTIYKTIFLDFVHRPSYFK